MVVVLGCMNKDHVKCELCPSMLGTPGEGDEVTMLCLLFITSPGFYGSSWFPPGLARPTDLQ